MNKLFFMFLLFTSFSYADLDLGEDFVAGEVISAEEFNNKFGKLKMVLGEVKDADILGTWDCTSFKDSTLYIDWSHEIENGGNGQVGDGYFYSNSGTLTFSELDEESSLNSPKKWSITRADVLFDNGSVEGSYTLLLNKIHFYTSQSGSDQISNILQVQFIDENKFLLEPSSNSEISDSPNPNVVCEKVN